MKPTGADNRTRNLLILRAPATARVPVTAEVASSSLVVPAISFKDIEEIGKNCHGPLWSKSKKTHAKSCWLFGFLGPILVQELSNCRCLGASNESNWSLKSRRL